MRRGENIYKRKDGRWEGRYIQGRGPDGRARYRSVYARTYSEVKAKMALRAAPVPAQPPAPAQDGPETVRELMALWLEEKRNTVKLSTWQRYRALSDVYIVPRLGKRALSGLTAEELKRFLADLSTSGRVSGTGGLAPKMVRDIYTALRSALRLAEGKFGPLAHARLDMVKAPAAVRRTAEVFSEQEIQTMTAAAVRRPTVYNTAFLLTLGTGLRLGEVCALKWSDIDLRDGVLRVERTALRVKQDKGTRLMVQTPKTARSRRIIPLSLDLIGILSSLRKRCSAQADAYLLTGMTDQPMEPRTMQNRFCTFQKLLSLRPRGYHTLRHTFASRSVELGTDIKTLSMLLGHANVSTTLQMYVHPTQTQLRRAVERFNTFRLIA